MFICCSLYKHTSIISYLTRLLTGAGRSRRFYHSGQMNSLVSVGLVYGDDGLLVGHHQCRQLGALDLAQNVLRARLKRTASQCQRLTTSRQSNSSIRSRCDWYDVAIVRRHRRVQLIRCLQYRQRCNYQFALIVCLLLKSEAIINCELTYRTRRIIADRKAFNIPNLNNRD